MAALSGNPNGQLRTSTAPSGALFELRYPDVGVLSLVSRRRAYRAGWSTISPMQVATGTVVNGKIVLEGVALPEGAVVTVVTRGADESFSLSEAQEDELISAMAEIERGEYVSLNDLPRSLPKQS